MVAMRVGSIGNWHVVVVAMRVGSIGDWHEYSKQCPAYLQFHVLWENNVPPHVGKEAGPMVTEFVAQREQQVFKNGRQLLIEAAACRETGFVHSNEGVDDGRRYQACGLLQPMHCLRRGKPEALPGGS